MLPTFGKSQEWIRVATCRGELNTNKTQEVIYNDKQKH